MFARIQRIHFVGIGGIGMSGIAQPRLQNLRVASQEFSHYAASRQPGRHNLRGTQPAKRSRCRSGRHQFRRHSGESRSRRSPQPAHPSHTPRRNARGVDATQVRHRHRGDARQNHDHFHGGRNYGNWGSRSNRRSRRPCGCHGFERPPRQVAIPGRRSRRKRSLIPEALAHPCGGDQHRP